MRRWGERSPLWPAGAFLLIAGAAAGNLPLPPEIPARRPAADIVPSIAGFRGAARLGSGLFSLECESAQLRPRDVAFFRINPYRLLHFTRARLRCPGTGSRAAITAGGGVLDPISGKLRLEGGVEVRAGGATYRCRDLDWDPAQARFVSRMAISIGPDGAARRGLLSAGPDLGEVLFAEEVKS